MRSFPYTFCVWTVLAGSMAIISLEITSAQAACVCFPERYLSVHELYDFCKVPGKCGKPLACEEEISLVQGTIDYDNVFEHSGYPQLPYEKFFLMGDAGSKLEVVALSPDNATLFGNLFAAQKEGKRRAYLKGTVRGTDQHIMGACRRDIRLELTSPDDLDFR